PALSHRYYKLKAKWFGGDRLDYWDRNAPLPEDLDRSIAWPDATKTVLEAYAAFSPQLATIGNRFFDQSWIDAPPPPGQAPRPLGPSEGAERAPLSAAELSRQDARRDDAGARARPRRASGAGRAAGRADGRHAADPGRDRLRIRGDADLPGAPEAGERS